MVANQSVTERGADHPWYTAGRDFGVNFSLALLQGRWPPFESISPAKLIQGRH